MMNIKKNYCFIRDFIFLTLLFLLIYFARKNKKKKIKKPIAQNSFVFHEIDTAFIDTIKKIEHYTKIAYNKDFFSKAYADEIIMQLQQIKKKYTTTSPATALLGPIGTTAIVLKEQRLKTQVLKILNELLKKIIDQQQEKNITLNQGIKLLEQSLKNNK
jgi:cell division protein FtsB